MAMDASFSKNPLVPFHTFQKSVGSPAYYWKFVFGAKGAILAMTKKGQKQFIIIVQQIFINLFFINQEL